MLNIMNPPADWSTLKKLIWLRGTPTTGGKELTVSGTPPLSLPNSLGKPLKAWSVDLLPYQEGSGDPAPDNVRPIHGTDKVTAWTSGKNLYSKEDSVYNVPVYAQDGTATAYADVAVWWMPAKPNTQYTVSCNHNEQVFYVRWINCDSNKGFISRVGSTYTESMLPTTITTPANCRWVQIAINQYETSQIALNDWEVMIVEGSTAADYEPYNGSQTVIDVPPLSANKWDEEWEKGTIDSSTGENKSDNTRIRSKNYTKILPNTTYYFVDPTSDNNAMLYYYTADKQYIRRVGWTMGSFTTPENAYYLRFILGTPYGTTYLHDISINYPSTVTTYNPFSNTLYGGTYDPVTGVGTIDRASVDLGTLSWLYRGEIGTGIFSTSGITDYVRNKLNIFAMCETYKNIGGVGGVRDMIGNPNAIGFYTESSVSAVYVVDERFTDATAFTSAVSGIKLVYELATPTPFTTDGHTIKLPKGNAYTWATAEDGTVDSMSVTYIGKASN